MTTLTVPQTEAELNGDLPAPTAAKTMRRDSLRRGTDPRCLSTASGSDHGYVADHATATKTVSGSRTVVHRGRGTRKELLS